MTDFQGRDTSQTKLRDPNTMPTTSPPPISVVSIWSFAAACHAVITMPAAAKGVVRRLVAQSFSPRDGISKLLPGMSRLTLLT